MAHAMLDPLENEEHFPFDRIVQVSNGLPYFIFEMCHYLLDKGHFDKDAISGSPPGLPWAFPTPSPALSKPVSDN